VLQRGRQHQRWQQHPVIIIDATNSKAAQTVRKLIETLLRGWDRGRRNATSPRILPCEYARRSSLHDGISKIDGNFSRLRRENVASDPNKSEAQKTMNTPERP